MAASHPVSPDHGHGDAHGSLKSYVVGFGLSVLLTLASFGTVMSGAVPHHLMMPGIVVFAVAQLLVQLVFFLHMGTSPGKRGNLAIMLFTVLILAIVVIGSLWVLHNMNANMMHPQRRPPLHDGGRAGPPTASCCAHWIELGRGVGKG